MNQRDHGELELLKRRQEALQRQLANLTVDIEKLSSRLNAAALPVQEIQPLEFTPLETVAPPTAARTALPEEIIRAAVPPPLPPVIPVTARTAAPIVEPLTTSQIITASGQPETTPTEKLTSEAHESFDPKLRVNRDGTIEPVSVPPPIPPLPQPAMTASVPPPVPPAPRARETFEMKLGTYWLVRVGIVMLLTGLVFLGTYAYKNYIGKFGAPGKVALLYTASAALLGFGGWLQRKGEKESLRNYGQVLFAGGLAAVYFTTYAAHHLEALRIIASPVIDALLLLAWGAVTVWIADRRKSEVLALFAVGLAYYTSAITPVGLFTLGSNLVLTGAAVFFLVRNRWTTLSFISVLATYGGFAFWRFHLHQWSWDARVEEVWHANFFLAGYWLFFTAAVFLARGKSLTNASRAMFASLNNAAFFGLVLLSMMHITHGNFWKFSLSFGTTLLGAALLARKLLPEETAVKNSYVVQGLTLVTLGFIAYFTGLHTALVLTAESVVLIFLGHQQKNYFVRAGGYITAALSTTWVCATMTTLNADVTIGAAITAAFLLNAWWENRNDAQRGSAVLRPFSGYFIALMVVVCAVTTWHATPEPWQPVAWMIEAIAFTALFYALRIPELPILSQALALAAQCYWFFQFSLRQHPDWNAPATLIGGTLALAFLGHHQKNIFVRASGYLAAAVGAVWVFTCMTDHPADLRLGAIMSAAFLFAAWWEHRNDKQRATSVVRPLRAYFIALAVAVCGVVTWHAVSGPWRPVAWMMEAMAFTIVSYGVRIPELPRFSQALALAALGNWSLAFVFPQQSSHWSAPATLIAGTLALVFLGHHQRIPVVRASGYLTAAVSGLWLLTRMGNGKTNLTIGAIMGAAFLFCAWWEHIKDEQRMISVVRPCRGYFVALTVAACGIITWHALSESWRPVAWMMEALVLTSLFYAVRIPELPLFSQTLALGAQGYWFFEFALRHQRPHWLVPATLVAGSLALSHWWQRQSKLQLLPDMRNALQIVYGLALVGVLFFWSKPDSAPAAWLAYLSMLAIGLTIYGVATRAWILAACAQLFLLISSVELYHQFLSDKPEGPYALIIIATWLVLGVGTTAWLSRHNTRDQVRRPLLQMSVFYRGVAFLMSLWWIYAYVPVARQFWVLCALGIALVALAGWRKNHEAFVFSGLFFAVAFAVWFTKIFAEESVVNWLNAAALLSIFATQQVLRRFGQRFDVPKHVDSAVILITGVALWTFVSRWVAIKSGTHFLITVSWAALAAALFTLGFALRERMHRWLALGILACAVGRVFLSDVWKLETIYRILSFMALGVVLLALGFIYNKYQEKIRQWL
jgi:hypothetical protein